MRKGDMRIISDGTRYRAYATSCVERYGEDGKLTPPQVAAGRMLYGDFACSGLAARVSGAYAETIPSAASRLHGNGPRYVDFTRAMNAMMPLERSIVFHVAVEDVEISRLARGIDWRRTLWTLLRHGLDDLVKHYGLASKHAAT